MKSKGFSLIELMVVIVIIGIIFAVAIPKFQEDIKEAEKYYVPSYRVVIDKYISSEGNHFLVVKRNGYFVKYIDVNMYYMYNVGDTVR
jgi:prepilin-type N-terminal cleavage/methylation domain-containing protein